MRYALGFALSLCLSACSGLQPIPHEKRALAAVIPLSYEGAEPEYSAIAASLTDSLAGALLRTGRLRMLERNRVEELLKELHYSQIGAVDPSTAAKVGKQLGARLIVLGSVTSVSVRDEARSVKFAEKTNREAEVEVQARIVDVESGELVSSGRAVGKASTSEKHAFGATLGELASKPSMVQKAIIGLGDRLAAELAAGVQPLP